MHGIERNLLVAAVVLDAVRGLRREIEQRADGAGGRLARAQFQHLAEQHQHGDHAGGLEIDRRRAVHAECRRENARRERGDDAVDIGDAGAHGDQREHVEIARDQRLRAAHEERPAGPQHHRRGEGELDPVGRRPAQTSARRNARSSRGPSPGQRARGRSRSGASCRRVRDWGRSQPTAFPAPAPCRRSGRSRGRPGGSADASGRCRSRLRRRRQAPPWLGEIFLRVGSELGAAAVAAEIIGLALIVGAVLGGCRDRRSCRRPDRSAPATGRPCAMVMMLDRAHDHAPCHQIPPGGI